MEVQGASTVSQVPDGEGMKDSLQVACQTESLCAPQHLGRVSGTPPYVVPGSKGNPIDANLLWQADCLYRKPGGLCMYTCSFSGPRLCVDGKKPFGVQSVQNREDRQQQKEQERELAEPEEATRAEQEMLEAECREMEERKRQEDEEATRVGHERFEAGRRGMEKRKRQEDEEQGLRALCARNPYFRVPD